MRPQAIARDLRSISPMTISERRVVKFLLAAFKHETNTFSPVVTDRKRFFKGSTTPICGEAAIQARRKTGTGMGGFLQVCEEESIEVSVAVVADARPSGIVPQEVFDDIATIICGALQADHYDGLLLDLHGAMVSEQHEDAEGELLRRIRVINADIPIGVALDMHANLYPEFIERVNVLTGFHTYPHVDMYETGELAAKLLVRTVRGEINPVLYWNNRPMMPHVMRQGTHQFPNRALQQRCRELEQSNVLAASLFVGFPHADIRNIGVSAVVCADGNVDVAKQECEALLDMAWTHRKDFLYQGRPLAESIAMAQKALAKPVVLLDHCDNVASGGTMDTTGVLKACLDAGLRNAVFFAIHDPASVDQAFTAGIGSTVDFVLGGKALLEATHEDNPSLPLTAKVINLHDGLIKLHGPMMAGMETSMGRTAVLETSGMQIVIIAGHSEPNDKSCFHSLGINVTEKDYVIIKSRVHWRAGLGDIAKTVIECDSVGLTTSDYSKLTFRHIRRPIYPIDAM